MLFDQHLREAFETLWNQFVDPAEACRDEEGEAWRTLAGSGGSGALGALPYASEGELAEIRQQCRVLAVSNEFALNAHENRISFLVGAGHGYRAAALPNRAPAASLVTEVQAVIDEFVRVNQWHKRQQEIVRRKDRDGECFLRFFCTAEGMTLVRFVEPEQVATPPEAAADPAASFGVVTEPDDVETVRGYLVEGRWVDAADIQHRKANVDVNAKRGLPLFHPVRKNLRRAEKLLRNMSVVAEIQSAIAIIRKHASGTLGGVRQFVQNQAETTTSGPGGTRHYQRFGPGAILDAFAGTEYQFPAAGLDAARYVAVLQAELRAIASRLVMPEFMLTSDASNANYASTMVAEGPAVRMFERLQHDLLREDEEVMRRVLANAARAGRLPPETFDEVAVRGTAPTLAVRDRLRDAQADQILVRNGAMSIATLATRHGLDPERERNLREVSLNSSR